MLSARFVVFILHLEHDGNHFFARCGIGFAEDKIAFGAIDHIVVFFEIRMRERRSTDFVEFGLAMTFERFTDHLGGKARLHFLNAGNFFVLVLDELVFCSKLVGHFLTQGSPLLSRLGFLELNLGSQLVALTLSCGTGLAYCKFFFGSELLSLRFQPLLLRNNGLLELCRFLGGHTSTFRFIGGNLLRVLLNLRFKLLLEGAFLGGKLLAQCRNFRIALRGCVREQALMLCLGNAILRIVGGR